MANAADVNSCHFHWDIFNPFVPWRRMVATFYHGSPTLTHWKVTLEPNFRLVNNWAFSFSLNGVKSGERDDIIVADRVTVVISLNGTNMENKEEIGYNFWRINRHTYEFQANVLTDPLREESHHLAIEVEIVFPSQNIANQGNGLVFNDDDLIQLSEDLRRLFISSIYSNLRLKSSDPLSNIPVHSYIMHARWCNFFRVHPVHTIIDDTVEINISDDLLRHILTYLYSGQLATAVPNLGIPSYMTELFQVIDRYELHHLYKVFTRDVPRQVRRTRKHLNINTKDFRLDGAYGRPLDDPLYTWQVNPNTAYEFVFQIKFFLSASVPWFRYSLQSRSPHEIYAQVNLKFLKTFVRSCDIVNSMHERDYAIGSNKSVESGTCHFERNSDDTNEIIAGNRRSRRGISHFIRCVLFLSDGTTVIEVESEDGIGLQDDGERFSLLGDHMYDLLTMPKQHDLRVSSRGEWPVIPSDQYSLHKSIFEIRVPEWRAVLEDVPEGNNIPDVVTCILRSEAFRPVLDYIYTGKVFPIPNHLLDEVDNFAVRGGLNSLRKLINEMR